MEPGNSWGWVTSWSLGWNKYFGALEQLGWRPNYDGYWCPTERWNQWFLGWDDLVCGALVYCWLMCLINSHIHAWNMARGWLDEEKFFLANLWLGGTWKSHLWLVFKFSNEEIIPLVFGMKMYYLFFGFHWCYIHGIFVAIMLVISVYFISDVVWLYLCFFPVNECTMYLWLNRFYYS